MVDSIARTAKFYAEVTEPSELNYVVKMSAIYEGNVLSGTAISVLIEGIDMVATVPCK
jgi:hypothetical protein